MLRAPGDRMHRVRQLLGERAFQAGFFISLCVWLLCAELFCRVAAGSGFWYRHLDFSGRLVSRAELRDRLAYETSRPGSVCLLADSIAGSSALIENLVADAERASLTRRLQAEVDRRGRRVFSLSADGLLLPDIEAITVAFDRARPAAALILLNYRMFAPEFQAETTARSRAFLVDGAASWSVVSVFAEDSAALAQQVERSAQQGSALFRTTQLLKTLWYFPSQKAFLQQHLQRWLARAEDDDLAKAALKLKVASYYQDVSWQTDSPAFRSLSRLVDRLGAADIPTHIVLTPQNVAFLSGILDPARFAENRRRLAEFLAPRATGRVTYADWADRYPARQFLDHCHLTRAGNDAFAADLARLLEGGSS